MQEIKCPKCGEIFQVDESGYSAIVKQVRDKEFSKEIQNREAQFESEKESAIQLAKLEAEKMFNEKLNKKENELSEVEVKKDKEIAELKNKLATFDKDKELEINKLITKLNTELSEKDSHIATLKGEKALTEKECQLKEQSLKEQYEEKLRTALNLCLKNYEITEIKSENVSNYNNQHFIELFLEAKKLKDVHIKHLNIIEQQ